MLTHKPIKGIDNVTVSIGLARARNAALRNDVE